MIQSVRWNGEPISSPGVYSDMPLDEYHRADICDAPSVSSTPLRHLWEKSPKHCWAHSPLNPQRIEEEESESLILGRAAHWLICQQVDFAETFVVRPDKAPDGRPWNGNNETCKHWLRTQKRAGKTVLTPAQVDRVKGMAISLGDFPLVREGALNGLIERSFFWQDKETGLWLKARPDAIPSDSGDFSDLKTTLSVLYRDLQSALATYGYHQQAALVMEGARALGIEPTSFTLIWIESKEPHCCRAQTLKDDDIARGMRQNRVAVRTFADCLSSGVWPGPGDDRADAEYIDLPDWKRKQIDERLKYELREAA
jgi:hypothetical protein